MKTIITISRQYGSGGREIGRKLAEQLGVPFYDNEIISRAAKETGFSEAAFETVEDKATNSLLYSIAMGMNVFTNQDAGFAGLSLDDRIFLAQSNVIRKVAEEGGCVIVGRCSDFILEEMKNSMHIYIYAPYDVRVQQSVENLKLELSEARQMIVDVDEARDSYHMHYAGYLPDDKNHKDILIDSSFLGVEKTAQYLAEAVRQKFGA